MFVTKVSQSVRIIKLRRIKFEVGVRMPVAKLTTLTPG